MHLSSSKILYQHMMSRWRFGVCRTERTMFDGNQRDACDIYAHKFTTDQKSIITRWPIIFGISVSSGVHLVSNDFRLRLIRRKFQAQNRSFLSPGGQILYKETINIFRNKLLIFPRLSDRILDMPTQIDIAQFHAKKLC